MILFDARFSLFGYFQKTTSIVQRLYTICKTNKFNWSEYMYKENDHKNIMFWKVSANTHIHQDRVQQMVRRPQMMYLIMICHATSRPAILLFIILRLTSRECIITFRDGLYNDTRSLYRYIIYRSPSLLSFRVASYNWFFYHLTAK